MISGDYLPLIGQKIDSLGYRSGIVAGGSYSYGIQNYSSLREMRDIDLVMFFDSPEDIVGLLTKDVGDFRDILRLRQVEHLFVRDELAGLHGGLAGVRYSGINRYGQKLSVKLLLADVAARVFGSSEPQWLNVLSVKDRRVYRKRTLSGKLIIVGLLNEKLPGDLVILRDADLYVCGQEFSLGVVADLFLSSVVIHDSLIANPLSSLEKKIIDKVMKLAGQSDNGGDWARMFVRQDRFPDSFRKKINEKFGGFPPNHKGRAGTVGRSDYFLFGGNELSGSENSTFGIETSHEISEETRHDIKERDYIDPGPFSSNSRYGVMRHGVGQTLFFKETNSHDRYVSELNGLKSVQKYYGHLQHPVFSMPQSNLIAYPWNDGTLLAQKRLSAKGQKDEDWILELGLRRAEDILRGYLSSASDYRKGKADVIKSKIQDLFHERLVGDRLFDYYQGHRFLVGAEELSLDQFLGMDFVVNGEHYPSLNYLMEIAKEVLCPENINNGILVCGLGDAHAGNVMCTDFLDEYLYIDYEFSGWHSPYLDMAKPIYNDVSFDVLYADIQRTGKKPGVSAEIKSGKIILNHDYRLSDLSRMIFKTKIDGIILPFNKLSDVEGDDNWWKISGCAMICCGLLTRNLVDFRQDIFWLNIANTIQMTDLKKFYGDNC